MNDKERIIKRSIIILIYLLVFGLFFVGIYYFISPQETCFDGIKNQNEEGIDCGGNCSPCQNFQYEDLKIVKSGITQSGRENQIDVFVQVENPNSHLGIKKIEYDINVLGESDSVIAKTPGESFFLPHEKKTIIKNNLKIGEKKVEKIEWKAKNIEWVNFDSSFESPNFRIINKKMNFDFSGSSVSGLLINNSPYDFSLVGIKVILKDKDDNIRFINSTEMRTVKSEEEREFKAIWPGKLPDEIIKMDVEAEVNIFDPQSYFEEYYEVQKFQELKPI